MGRHPSSFENCQRVFTGQYSGSGEYRVEPVSAQFASGLEGTRLQYIDRCRVFKKRWFDKPVPKNTESISRESFESRRPTLVRGMSRTALPDATPGSRTRSLCLNLHLWIVTVQSVRR